MIESAVSPLLVVEHLRVEFPVPGGMAAAVSDVSLTLAPGRILGIVGESGSGKSMTAYSILGLIDPPGQVTRGRILFKGQDLRKLSDDAMRALRGNRIAMVFQDPMMTLNPVLRIDTQMVEAIQAHRSVPRNDARRMACRALDRVGIPSPLERLKAYPHEFSGGMRQRVAIAIALLNQPDLIVCDEPTTALDVTIQHQILQLMRGLCRENNTALIWITHDLAVVAGLADDVAVMVGGHVVERGPAREVLTHPHHPYTRGLIASSPSRNVRGQRLTQIPGAPISAAAAPQGCPFQPRCSRASSSCQAMPAMQEAKTGHAFWCHHPLTGNANDD